MSEHTSPEVLAECKNYQAVKQSTTNVKQVNGSTKVHSRRSIVTLICPHCDKVFSGDASFSGVRSNYRRHLLIHSHERPHQCVYCGDGFTTRQNMKRHVRLCHPALASPSLTSAHSPKSKLEENKHTHGTKDNNNNTEYNMERSSRNEVCSDSQIEHENNNVANLENMMLPDSMHTYTTKESDRMNALCFTERNLQTSKHELQMEVQEQNKGEDNNSMKSIDREILAEHNAICKEQQEQEKVQTSITSTTLASESPVLKVTFTCVDCEAELSSKTKLRRHMRFHCPFRDNVETDFVADLFVHKKKEEAMKLISTKANIPRAVKHIKSETPYQPYVHKATKSSLTNIKNYGDQSYHDNEEKYEWKDGENEEEEDEEEEHYLRRVAEENKMRYYANANDSDYDDEMESGSEYTQSSDDDVNTNTTTFHDEFLHENEFSTNDDKNKDEDTEVDDEWHNLQKLHLAYHRRRSGHKRSRRILRKRLRANERRWNIMSNGPYSLIKKNNNSNKRDNMSKNENDIAVQFSPEEDQANNNITKNNKNTNRDNKVLERYTHVSSSLYENAVAIASASHKESNNNTNCRTSVVCPFESCEKSFAKRKYWLAHVSRCHPVQYAEMRKNDVHAAEHLIYHN